MSDKGYLRYATINKDLIVFACEDDLWAVGIEGGLARRLTAGSGECSLPRISPDGRHVAFAGLEEGHSELYVISSDGGTPERVTYLGGATCLVSGWSQDGKDVLFATDARSPFLRHTEAFKASFKGGTAIPLNLGHVVSISFNKENEVLIGRNNFDPARWKRYKGGTKGDLWTGPSVDGEFRRLISLEGNLVWPMWIGKRAYFLSDHEGVGNIYSCRPDGSDLTRHTDHVDHFVRFPSTDGKNIAYTAGGSLFVFSPDEKSGREINVRVPRSTVQVSRKFVGARDNLEHFAPHPAGHSTGLIVRGQPLTAPFWEEAPINHGAGSAVRYRLLEWLNDGERFVVVSDEGGSEKIELHFADQSKAKTTLMDKDLGRILELAVSPDDATIALANHRQELISVDVKSGRTKIIDRSPAERLTGISFSPCGKWVAYSWSPYPNTSLIRIADLAASRLFDVTSALRTDIQPKFDPDGKYLYFLSTRDFNPVYDHLQFDLSFPMAMRPFVVTLRNDVESPFVARPRPVGTAKDSGKQSASEGDDGKKKSPAKTGVPEKIVIDFDGINNRVIGFPVEEGRYEEIVAGHGRVFFTQFDVKGIKPDYNWMNEEPEVGRLCAFDLGEEELSILDREAGRIRLAADRATLVFRSKDRLRVLDVAGKLPEPGQEPKGAQGSGRKSGVVDLDRIKVLIEPRKEWTQMYEETWRLQSEHFWDERMSGIDWRLVHDRYAALLERIRTRSEFSDLIWEMQGELGTSHAYELGGDYRAPRSYRLGFLGCDLVFDKKAGGYKVAHIVRGSSWEKNCDSPLAEPGLSVEPGDIITAVGGVPVDEHVSVEQLLLNSANRRVALTVKKANAETRRVFAHTLSDERLLRYRAWVEANRRAVHEKTGGRVGYVHIPDMGPWGFAEFHKSYLSEINRDGLIVDVRYNRGGHVSPLLLEKLIRKRVGYDISRWGTPMPYPPESVAGPVVGLTNQFAGSDGDIFTHCFKLYKVGPMVGKRTWGGVIGIWPRHRLVDGTITTQPEFSFWFSDVGFGVENYGTDPDYDIDIAPDDYRRGIDPQMDLAIELVLQQLELNPVALPDFSRRPSLPVPQKLGQSTSSSSLTGTMPSR